MVVFLKKHAFSLAVIVILLCAIILKFYDYPHRWGVGYDQAHDALLARYAVSHFNLPFLGPFSSAGPFQTGGEWYWFIMLPTAIFPFSVMSPWVFMTSLYVFFVLAIIVFSKELLNKPFALFVGAFAAVSSAQVSQGTNLTNQGPLAFFSLLSIWCAIRFLRTKKRRYLFLLSLFVSTAASIHLQGAALIMLVLFTLIFAGMPRVTDFLFVGTGFFLPWLPVLLVDLQHNFYNTKSMIQYYLHDQYNISLDVLGRRWLTYGGVFWPKLWGFIIGGNKIIGYAAWFALVLISFYSVWKKKITKEWLVLLASFFAMVVLLRYIRTPLFESYVVFLHPFIFLLSGWIVYFIYKKYKIFGILIFSLVIVFSLQKSVDEIRAADNSFVLLSEQLRGDLIKKFPDTKFALYDFRTIKHRISDKTYVLALFLDEKKLNAKDGRRVGLLLTDRVTIVDLQKKSHAQLVKEGWKLVTPEEIYLETEEWYKRNE